MSKPIPTGPWTEHRALAEAVGQAVADALTNALGTNVELGLATSFIPEEQLGARPIPMRAHVVRFRRPLRDVMIFLSPLRADVVRPLVEVAATAAIRSLDIPTGSDQHGAIGAFDLEDTYEFDAMDVVLEQCDGLYLEASYTLDLPMGELQMVLGTGMLESASSFVHGVADPFAEEPAYAMPGAELELGDAIELDESSRYEFEAAQLAGETAEASLGFAAAGAAPTSGIDAFEQELAAQELAEAEAAAAIAGSNAAAMAGGGFMAAGAAPADVAAVDTAETRRWADLLSGVEVELSAELGRTHLALGDITALDSASVLTLDQLINDPVTVYVNGTPYASARLVVVDGEYGIEIIEIVDQGAIPTPLAA
ncbi:MAG: fliN [Thermoleophilia bacterium]|nr:fliN [Thermoleophilia bacterium]